MTAIERVQAAIDKLAELRAESTPGPWVKDWDEKTVRHGRTGAIIFDRSDGAFYPDDEPTADLIVTLHRTIDPLLATLERWLEYRPLAMEEPIVALADAILGADS